MPLVHINLMEGRPPEKIEGMISAVSQAIADSIECDVNTVRVMVREMKEHQYGIGGKPMRVVRAERAAAEREDPAS